MSIVLASSQSSGASGHGKDNAQLCASGTVTNGCMCTVSFVLSRGKHTACSFQRLASRFSPSRLHTLHGQSALALIGVSSWYWIVLGGIAVRRWCFLMASIWCFCHLAHQSCSEASASGRSRAQAFTNRHFKTLDELQEVQAQRCVTLETRSNRYPSYHSLPTSGLPRPHKTD